MEKSKYQILKKFLPENPGIYKFLRNGKVIYVGKAVNIKKRVESYFQINLAPKTDLMVKEATSISYLQVTSELEALLLESKLIKKLQPMYNFIAKDDKHALYIKITNTKYPTIKAVRKNDESDSLYVYGPFPSSQKVYSVLKFLRKIFPYSDHKIGKKPCIYSQIKLCNPCPNVIEKIKDFKIKKQLQQRYLNNIKHIKDILDGNIKNVIKNLSKEMESYSKNGKYEDAIVIRNQIDNIKYITQKFASEDLFLENPNMSEDIRLMELRSLEKVLNVNNINRIECFDVSHISGYFATASMVTFINGNADKSLYRRFKIHLSKNNDIDAMKEIALRRERNLKKWGRPNLILVDGGKAQKKVFESIFIKYSIPVFAVTKGREYIDFPDNNALNLITRIRDESHRFAKKYHNLLFKKNLIKV